MELKFSRGKLRRVLPSDKPALLKYANNVRIAQNMTNLFPYPYTSESADEWIALNQQLPQPLRQFAIDIDGELVGATGLHTQPDVRIRGVEMGYWLAEHLWGQGIVTEVAKLMTEYAFETFDYIRVQAVVYGYNPASMRVLEKAGFVKEGILRKSIFKFNVLTDAHVFARINPNYEDGV